MNLVIGVILGAIVGWIVYLVMLAVPFLAPFATIGGLIAFLLICLGGYNTGGFNFPRR